jgi:cellulose biosynthesis protein BcsQ
MRSVAFFNIKGGVGKTTLAINLAAFLALERSKNVLLVDADHQCNATEAMFSDDFVSKGYSNKSNFSIYKVVQLLAEGKNFSAPLEVERSERFGVDVLVGDPRLALIEDVLARSWSAAVAGQLRGLRTALLFSELLSRCSQYDYVLFDLSPSLGPINRSVLAACRFFVCPISMDPIGMRAPESIATALARWRKQLTIGVSARPDLLGSSMHHYKWCLQFAGYASRQYVAMRDADGRARSTATHEKIAKRISDMVAEHFLADSNSPLPKEYYDLGTVPPLHSLSSLAQSARAPVFTLGSSDGVVGSQFLKIKESKEAFSYIADNLARNISMISVV